MRARVRQLGQRHSVLLPARKRVHRLARQLSVDAKGAELRARFVILDEWVGLHHYLQRSQRQVQAVHMMLAERRHANLWVALNMPRRRLEAAGYEVEKCRLADAVGTHDCKAALQVQPKVQVVEQCGAVLVPKRHVVERNDRRRDDADWLREPEDVVGVLLHLLHVCHALERLDARLDERGAVGIEAEAIDEGLHVFALDLVRFCRTLCVSNALRHRADKRAVVAFVGRELLAVQVDDVSTHTVEELPRMRHDEQSLRPLDQVLLQPQHCVQVQMVGRLVQKQ
mmetsp:Transcript_6209/g.19203  ORF Transcript_6209/g.19203 Transcript_6209/m.19203 type:complete len:283 (-) Transcript_6209:832-1680(-)